MLCFDEFTVTDIADAMIVSRLFSALFANGVTLVATSNVAPDDLYRDGLNRDLFLPFVTTLKRYSDTMSLNGDTDYRLAKINRIPVYLTPLSTETNREMDKIWAAVTAGGRNQARIDHDQEPENRGAARRRTHSPVQLCRPLRAAGGSARISGHR